jgi:hypothetical protein
MDLNEQERHDTGDDVSPEFEKLHLIRTSRQEKCYNFSFNFRDGNHFLVRLNVFMSQKTEIKGGPFLSLFATTIHPLVTTKRQFIDCFV